MSKFSQGISSRGMRGPVTEYRQTDVAAGTVEEVYVTHVTDPEHFYVQLTRQIAALDRLMEDLADHYGGAGVIPTAPLVLGGGCVSQFSEDGSWYRAIITGIRKNGEVEIRFVDYGNSEDTTATKVKEIKPEFLKLPTIALHCGLSGVATTQGFWSPEHSVQFEDLALNQTFRATFRGFKPDDGILSVELMGETGKEINKDFGTSTNTSCIEEPTSGGSVRRVQLGQGDAAIHVSLGNRSVSPAAGASDHMYSNGDNAGLSAAELSVGQNDVVVVYAFSPGEFWCQLVKNSDQLNALSSKLNQEYNKLRPGELAIPSPKVGMLCAAKFCEDLMWYRGQIQSIGSGEMEVYFVDYGNTEKITADLVKELRSEFKRDPSQGVKCMLANLKSTGGVWSDVAAEEFETLSLDRQLLAVYDGRIVEGKYPVRLKDSEVGHDIGEKLADTGLGILVRGASVIPRVPAHLAKIPSFAKLDVPIPYQTHVFLSWVDTPGSFWVQLSNKEAELNSLVDKVQELYSSQAPSVRSILPGMAVVAQYSADESWYRAIVQKMRGRKVDVLFVDFGNNDSVGADTLKEASSQITGIPMQALQCGLGGIRPLSSSSEWTDDAKVVLEDITKDGVTCKFVSQRSGSYVVKLEVNGKDVAAELVAAGVVRRVASESPEPAAITPISSLATMKFSSVSLSPGQTESGYVSHTSSLSSFWFQMLKTFPQLSTVMDDLEGFYSRGNGIQLPKPQVGVACVTKFSEDEAWYRAAVEKMGPSGIELHFVDYGNSEVKAASTIFAIGSQFISLPTQAIHCKLALPQSTTDEMIEAFHNLVAEKEVVMKVLSVDGKIHTVDILESGRSVTDKLKSVFPALQAPSRGPASSRLDYLQPDRPVNRTEKVFLTFTETPNKFYVHMHDVDERLNALTEKLTAIYKDGSQPPLTNPSPGQPCCALYAEDGSWYRGKVVSSKGEQLMVQFVDYGNADSIPSRNVKSVSADLLSPGPFALECCLESATPASGTEWIDEATAFFETMTVDKDIQCAFKQGKNVSLTVEGIDVAKKMQEKGFAKGSMSEQASAQAPSDSVLSLIYNPQAVPAQPNKAFVTHVDEDGVFYVQLASAGDLIEELSERLQELYNGPNASAVVNVQRGAPCCAKFTDDEAWYRAIIERVDGARLYVRFIDFGNSDAVNRGDVRALEVDFFAVPPLAFQCRLQGMSTWKPGQKQKFTDTTQDQEVTVEFLTKSAPYAVEVSLGGKSLLKVFTPDAQSPPRSLFGETSSSQKKPTTPPNSGWNSQPPKKSFGSAPAPDAQPPKRAFGAPQEDARPQRSFGAPAPKSDWDSAADSGPHKKSFTSPPAKEESRGRTFGSAPAQGRSFASPPSKPAPPPTLEKIPPQEQVFAVQVAPSAAIVTCISHVDKDDIYLQPTKDINTILGYSNKIGKLPTNEVTPAVGLACGALFSEDNTWYRCLVTDVTADKISVKFVDFGNADVVAPSKLKQLNREMLNVSPFTYRCRLSGVQKLTPELTDVLAAEASDKELTVKFLSQEVPYTAEMKTKDGKDIAQILCPNKFPDQSVPKVASSGVVSNISIDGKFYIQLTKDKENTKNLEEQLKKIYAKGTIDNPGGFENGKPCCACYPDDKTWQRGTVTNVEGGNIQVYFVDIGVTETIKSAYVQILPREFMFTPPYAYECILKDFTSWTEDQRDKFIAMTDAKTMNIQFVSQGPTPFKVDMTRSVGLELLGEEPDVRRVSSSSGASSVRGGSEEKSADETPTVYPKQKLPESETGNISFVDIGNCFYVQLSSEEEKLEAITEALQVEYSESGGERFFGLTVGSICCAKFSEDDAWYRAVATKITGEQITVTFVDYGNTDVVTIEKIAVLTEKNLVVPPLAYRCSLAGVRDWTETLTEQFDEATKEQTLTMTFQEVGDDDGERYSVELKLEDGQDIKDVLADAIAEAAESAAGGYKRTAFKVGDKVSVYVSHVESSLDFWVQTVASETNLANIGTAISEGYEDGEKTEPSDWLKEGCAVVAKYAEDDQWYRGTVLNVGEDTCKVLFVDYGNADDVTKANVYPIKPEHTKLSVQAVSCKLGRLAAVEGKEDAAMDSLFEMTNEKTLSLEVVMKLKDGKVKYVVSLRDGETDIRRRLVEGGLCTVTEEDKTDGEKTEADTEICEKTEADVEIPEKTKADAEITESKVVPVESETVAEDDAAAEAEVQDDLDTTPSPFSSIDLQEGQRISVHVQNAVTPSEFYIQPESCKRSRDALMEAMYEFYNDLAEGDMTLDTPLPGQACATTYGEDESWYRGKVRSVDGDSCRVVYVDFGNSDTVPCSSVRKLPDQFMKLPAQAVRCSLAGVYPKEGTWEQEAVDLFGELTDEKTLIMDILNLGEDGHCNVHLLHMGLAVSRVLLEKNLGVEVATPVAVSHKVKRIFSDASTPQKLQFEKTPESEQEESPLKESIRSINSTLNIADEYKVFTSHVVSPSLFYCQMTASVAALQQLMERLQTAYATRSSDPADRCPVAVGDLGVARFAEDGQYFRAKVTGVKERDLDVLLLDNGRDESVSMSDFLALTSEFKEEPCHAFLCCLSGVIPDGEEWTDESCSRFQKLVDGKELAAKVVSNLDSSCVHVDLALDDTSIGKTLVKEKLAVVKEDADVVRRIEALIKPVEHTDEEAMTTLIATAKKEDGFEYLDLTLEKDYLVTVPEAATLDVFALNLSEVARKVEAMTAEISEYVDKEASGDWQPTVGKACLVSRDSVWFRARLDEVEEESYKVYLVDCKEMLQCARDRIRELPERFCRVPVNGIECQLADIEPVDGKWSAEAVSHFRDLLGDSLLAAFLVSKSDEGMYYVRVHDLEDMCGTTVNRQLVDLELALPRPGSLVEMELQLESEQLDTSILEETEQSFLDISCMRENSIGDSDPDHVGESVNFGETFNMTDHSLLLDETGNTTRNTELGDTTQDTEIEVDEDTPRADSTHVDLSQDICGDIVDNLVARSENLSEQAGHDVCKNIVENLVDSTGVSLDSDKDLEESDQKADSNSDRSGSEEEEEAESDQLQERTPKDRTEVDQKEQQRLEEDVEMSADSDEAGQEDESEENRTKEDQKIDVEEEEEETKVEEEKETKVEEEKETKVEEEESKVEEEETEEDQERKEEERTEDEKKENKAEAEDESESEIKSEKEGTKTDRDGATEGNDGRAEPTNYRDDDSEDFKECIEGGSTGVAATSKQDKTKAVPGTESSERRTAESEKDEFFEVEDGAESDGDE